MDSARLFRFLIPLLWLAGFFFSLPLAQPHELARLAAVACFALAGLLAFWQGGGASLKSPLMIAALLFWANAGASVLWSPAPMTSFVAVCTFSILPFSLMVFSGRSLPDGFFRFCAAGAGVVLAVLAAWALLQYFVLHDFLVHGQVRHPFANPNNFAALLVLGFFWALGVMMTEESGARRNLALVLAALLLAAVVVIGGRAALLALMLVFAVMIFLLRDRVRAHARCLGAVLATGVAALFFSIWLKPAGTAPVERIARLAEGAGDLSVFSRLRLWESTLAMIRDHFPFGTGFGTFSLYYPAYRKPEETYSGGFMAHSDPLQFAAEAGISAPLLFYSFLILAALRMIKTWRVKRDPLTLAVFCGLAAMIAHAHIDFNLYSAPVLALSGLMLGWWLRETERGPDLKPDAVRSAMLALPVIAVLFMLQGFLRSEYHANIAQEAGAAGDVTIYAAEIEAANKAGWGWNARPYVMAAAVPLGILEAEGATLAADEKAAFVKRAYYLLEKAEEKNARLAAIPAYRARLAMSEGDPQNAAEFMKRALVLNPHYLSAPLMEETAEPRF